MRNRTVALIFFLINFSSFGYINIYPLKFEKEISKGAFEEFVLYNRSSKVRKYRVYVEDIEGRNFMTEWTKVYPKSVTLNPLEEAEVKVYVEAPTEIQDGVYETNLVFKEIALPSIKLSEEEKNKKMNVLTQVKMRLKGKVERKTH